MESIAENPLFEYHPDTLQVVRNAYGLDTPERVIESVDRLQEWIEKQNYFKKKDFSRDYLEKIIISTKGSVEVAKKRLEKICILRTITPFEIGLNRANDLPGLDGLIDFGLPKLTKDHHRVYMIKGQNVTYNSSVFQNICRRMILYFEYWMKYEYAKGLVAVWDGRESNLIECVKMLAVSENRNLTIMLFDCYVSRIQGMHFIMSSKLVSTVKAFLKMLCSAKIFERFHFHDTLESLHQVLDKDILPIEYGGNEVSMMELHKKWLEVLSTDSFMETMREMQEATIDVKLKSTEDFSENYQLGLAGSFRKLNVD